jgi:hypothetical protein
MLAIFMLSVDFNAVSWEKVKFRAVALASAVISKKALKV